MNPVEFADAGEESPCPKRVWVLTTLSDDEALASDGALPQGLQFHLSRCPACRRDADRLLSVSDALRELSSGEPPLTLIEEANAQLATALAHGAALSGRVTIPDLENVEAAAPTVGSWPVRFLRRYAAAAIIVLAMGWAGFAALNRSSPRSVPPQPTVSLKTAPRSNPVPDAANEISQPAAPAADAVAASERRNKAEPPERRYCTGLPYISDDTPDDANCIQRAFALPLRGRQTFGLSSGNPRLDNPPPPVSTNRLPNER